MWQKVLFKKIGVLFLASMVFGGSLWSNDELFNKIDALIYVSKNPNIIERNKKTIAIAGQINSILSARYDVLLSQSEDAIVALNGQINTYKNNKDMLKYLKTAKATEESNYYNVRKLSTKFKAVKAFGAVGNALNVYDLIKTSNEAYVNIQEGKANYKNTFLPIAEKIISFNPVAGGLVHIKNEIDTGMTLSRSVGEEYSNEIYNIRDRYFKQYHILANKGIEGKNPEKMIELFKQQRKGMRVELDVLLKELNTGTMAWLPVFGKDKARDELIKIRYGILGEDKEKRIIEKQNNIYNKMYKHYENNVIIKNKSSDIEKLNTNVSTHISEKLKEIDTPIVNNDKKEQPIVNKQKEAKIDLDKKKSEADNLRAENAKLASEYEALYKQSKANPNDKTLKVRLESKDKELRKNAQAFIE